MRKFFYRSLFNIIKDELKISTPSLFKIKITEDTKKIAYIYQVYQDSTIDALVLEDLPIKTRRCTYLNICDWQMQTLKIEEAKLISNQEPDARIQKKFIKYGWDRQVYYGDGGRCFLRFPVYKVEYMHLKRETVQNLIKKLEALGNIRQDWHKDAPVLDIIDPDLGPNYYLAKSLHKAVDERSKYAWFPVDVLVYPDRRVKLLGSIHNLERKGNEELYQGITEVFESMLPGFEKLFSISENEPTLLQVVIKAQKYVIQPGTTYSGKWHVEGKTEKIMAGGVHYLKIDRGFKKDNLIFRPKKSPSPYYCEGNKIITEIKIPVNQGSSIVFSNTLPHKFLKLKNKTSHPLERLFLNFFIVNPENRLESTSLRFTAFKVLKQISVLPNVLIDEILSFVFFHPNLNEAKFRRELAREGMKVDKSGWGFINYGNSGDVEFIKDTDNRDISDYTKLLSSSIEVIK